MQLSRTERSVRDGLGWVSKPLAVIGALAVVVIMLLTTLDVAWRTFAGGSFGGLVEYSQILIVVGVFLGLAHTQLMGRHVTVDLLVTRLSPRTARAVERLALVVCLIVLGWIFWATLQAGLTSFRSREFRFGVANVPVWPAKLAIPLGVGMWFLALLIDLIWPRGGRVEEDTPSEHLA